MRSNIGVAVLGLALAACGSSSPSLGPGSPDARADAPGLLPAGAPDATVPDGGPGVPSAGAPDATLPDGASTGSVPDAGICLPGATKADCDLCEPLTSSTACLRACPKVDCSQFPVPAECAEVCAGAPCCSCQYLFGDEYGWSAARVTCGTECSSLRAKYQELWADPKMTACASASDCSYIGAAYTCDTTYSLAQCGRAGNTAAYNASQAPALERQYQAAQCKDHAFVDCGGAGKVDCVGGICTVTAQSWCHTLPPRDAGMADAGG